MPPSLSIIIPTYQREELLQTLLDSLLNQTVLPGRFEVIVVDNNPMAYQPTHDLCGSSRYSLLNLKCINDPILGFSEARNFGVRQAKASWIGFLDDDERLPAHWVERAIEIIQNDPPDIFGGPYHPHFIDQKPAWFKDSYLTISLNQGKGFMDCDHCLFGGNIVFARSWLDRLGGYSTEMGRKGNNQEAGEATEIQLRAHREGARIYYDPDLYVFHHVFPEQLNANWFVTKAWYDGKARALIASADIRKRLIPGRNPLVRLGLFAGHSISICLKYLGIPFRDRKVMAFRENYLVQSFAPAVSTLAMNWYLFVYSLRKRG